MSVRTSIRTHATAVRAMLVLTVILGLAYPAVMLLVGVAIWAASHYHQKTRPQRRERWLDTHYAEWLHHRH